MALPVLTQSELVDELADRTGLSKGEIRSVIANLEDVIAETIKACERVRFAGITVEPKLKKPTKARMGRNPQTGDPVKIAKKPASVRVVAKVAKPLVQKAAPSVKKLTSAV